MKKRGWIALLCGLLAVCPALAEQTDGVVRVGEVTYDVQSVQNSLNAGYLLYESSGIGLSAARALRDRGKRDLGIRGDAG